VIQRQRISSLISAIPAISAILYTLHSTLYTLHVAYLVFEELEGCEVSRSPGGLAVLHSEVPDTEALDTLLVKAGAHGRDHVVLKPVAGVQLEGDLSNLERHNGDSLWDAADNRTDRLGVGGAALLRNAEDSRVSHGEERELDKPHPGGASEFCVCVCERDVR
jgi:hypothetical protein